MNREKHEAGRLSLADGLAILALALGIGVRIWGAWVARALTEPDPTVVALMARHMAALKDFPIFFYGQSYMGSLEPMASALLVWLLGSKGFVVALGPVLFATAALFCLWRWARTAAGPWGGLAAVVAGLFGPAVYFQFQMAPRGGYMVARWVDALALWAAARMSASLRAGQPVAGIQYFGLGLLAGVGRWSNMIVVSAVGVSALLLLHGMHGKLWRHARGILAGLVGFAAGFSPWLVWNARHAWASLAMSQIGGHAPVREALRNSWDRLVQLQDSGTTVAGPHLPLVLTAAVLALAVAGVGVAVVQRHKASLRENYARAGAILFCVVFALVFATSGFTRTHTARYWVPLVPGLAVLMAVACASPGWKLRRFVAWGLLGSLTLVQGGLCLSALRISGAKVEGALATYRELGAALERTGADALMAPIQLYALNFALDERFAVSNGKQEFYAPILRQVEEADAPAYSSDFNGIETFLRQQGAEWDSTAAGGRSLLWNVRRSLGVLREIPSAETVSLRDGKAVEVKSILMDRNLDTDWSPGVARASMLEWNFLVPQDIQMLQLVFSHSMVDEAYHFPRRIRIEMQVAGEWRTVLADEPINPLEWSGPRVYALSGLTRLEFQVGAQGVAALRIGLLDTPQLGSRVNWRLAEVGLFALEAPGGAPLSVENLGAGLPEGSPDAVVYAPRWLSIQLLKHGLVSENRLPGLAARIYGSGPNLPRDGTLVADRPCLFLVEPQHAPATRATLESQSQTFHETVAGAWILFEVEAGGFAADGLGLPPSVVWTGDALLAGHTAARAGEALRRLRAQADSEEVQRALLREIMRGRPSALSGLTEEETRRLGGEAAVQARQNAARFPEKSCPTEFANGIRLEGVDLAISAVPAGKNVFIQLYWSARADFEAGQEIVFIHLRDEQGNLVAQDDYRGSPLLWGNPAVRPVPGECVEEVRRITIPDTATPGLFSLSVGLYQPKSGRRVKVLQSEAPELHRHAATWPYRIQVIPSFF